MTHAGLRRFVLYDPDRVEWSNLNRLVGATETDARRQEYKVVVASRLIRGLHSSAEVEVFRHRWQEDPMALRRCDVIFGCVDGLAERRELEVSARRFLIPYIDIGLDVHEVAQEPPALSGQVILSLPGAPCLSCLDVLTKQGLAEESGRYGAAGPRPQVVWANGALASTAVGVAIDLLTGWTRGTAGPVYLVYYGNDGTLSPALQLQYLQPSPCPHFPSDQVGDVVL